MCYYWGVRNPMELSHTTSRAWVSSLPYARPAYPDTLIDKVKYFFWHLITPAYLQVLDLLSYMRILRNQGRQNYLLGKLAPGETVEGFVEYLLKKGFGNHFLAFKDDGQLVSLRYAPNFKYQYHVRVFNDGEVRGHFEYTPEYRPFKHLKGDGLEARFDEFVTLLGDKITPVPLSHKDTLKWSLAGFHYHR